MDEPSRPGASSLFQVYLRLRPPHAHAQQTQRELYPQLPAERFLTVEKPTTPTGLTDYEAPPTHITINPPSDSRKRAIEKFAFTRVFEEETGQLGIFRDTGHVNLINGVICEGRDGLLATLGVTGSGKSHTILGTRTQRGITQMSLDYLFRSLGSKVVHPVLSPSLVASLDAADASEGQLLSASNFLDSIYGDGMSTRAQSRATTPAVVNTSSPSASPNMQPPLRYLQQVASLHKTGKTGLWDQWTILGLNRDSVQSPVAVAEFVKPEASHSAQAFVNSATTAPKAARTSHVRFPSAPRKNDLPKTPSKFAFWTRPPCTRARTKPQPTVQRTINANQRQEAFVPATPRRNAPPRPKPQTFPVRPSLDNLDIPNAPNADYAVVVSMYEVYNDRVFDLLQTSTINARGDRQRRALLFKSTELSPDRKVVAGLRKVVCGSYDEAMMVLETGLTERRVAGTGSNSVSSRSHGFFVVEVKKRDTRRGAGDSVWAGGVLTIVDLAGSERAKNSKTAGNALAEAGKINESLMYLGQCLQMQSDIGIEGGPRTHLVPFRQCKLTELLFANSFVAGGGRHAQRGIMIVTADPVGDFNATSQILRYSALAREITVPRIPSVASEIGGFTPETQLHHSSGSRPGTAETAKFSASTRNGRVSPADSAMALGDLVAARGEAERLFDEVAILAMRLAEEQARRREAEAGWAHAEERAEQMEREVREECFEAMEARLEEEKRRWLVTRDEERDQMDEEMDRKIEMLVQERDESTIKVHEDAPPSPDSRILELESENASLRSKLEALQHELQCQSPTKGNRKRPTTSAAGKENLHAALGKLDLDAGELPAAITKTPGKKVRKLTPKTTAVFDEDDVFGADELA